MSRVDEIWERLSKATPGPWCPIINGNTIKSHAIVSYSPDKSGIFKKICCGISIKTTNAELIANAPSDIDYLLSELDRVTRERDAAIHDLEQVIDVNCICQLCSHQKSDGDCELYDDFEGGDWEIPCDAKWRGVVEETDRG